MAAVTAGWREPGVEIRTALPAGLTWLVGTAVPAPGMFSRAGRTGLRGDGDGPCCHTVWARADGPRGRHGV